MTEDIQELRKAMLESRQAVSEYIERFSRPMTEEERRDFEKTYVATFPSTEQTQPRILEFKTLEDAQELKRLQDVMKEKQQAFYQAYLKLKELNEQK
jgi:hypothetical protein